MVSTTLRTSFARSLGTEKYFLELPWLRHGQATDMDMKAFEDFWKIFAIGNFKKP